MGSLIVGSADLRPGLSQAQRYSPTSPGNTLTYSSPAISTAGVR